MSTEDLRKNADALESWFKSMDSQRQDWGYSHGVEATASDALQGVYRLVVSVVEGMRQTAQAIEAQRAATGNTDAVEDESAVGNADAPKE